MQLNRVERAKLNRRKRMGKYKLVLLTGLVMALLIPATSCTLPGLDKKTPEPVAASANNQSDFYEVKKATLTAALTGIGYLVPSKSTSLYFKDVSGPLSKIYFNLNDVVKAGDLVAEILPSDQQLTIQQQELSVKKDVLRMEQLRDEVISIQNQIKSATIDFERLLKDIKDMPARNKSSLDKAKLALDQLKLTLTATESNKKMAETDLKIAKQQNQTLKIESIKIKIQQLYNDIAETKFNIELAQAAYDKAVKADKTAKTTDSANAVKQAQLDLNQYKTDLTSLENSKELAELELKIAQGDLGKVDLEKANLKYQQMSNELLSLNKAIAAAQISLDEIVKSNADSLILKQEELKKAQIGLAQLGISLKTAQKNVQLAELDQKNNELLVKESKAKLANCKLYSSVGGIISFVDSVTETDLISANKTIIRVTDPKNMVFQMTAADGRYLKDIRNATMTIGQDKFTVSLYAPQPGDQLDTSATDPLSKNRFYLSFSGSLPKVKLSEEIEAKLNITKENVMVVPETCITEDNGKSYVDLVKGHKVETIEIIRGISADGQVEVIGGLNPGDKIVMK